MVFNLLLPRIGSTELTFPQLGYLESILNLNDMTALQFCMSMSTYSNTIFTPTRYDPAVGACAFVVYLLTSALQPAARDEGVFQQVGTDLCNFNL